MVRDPHIARRHAAAARTFQLLFPAIQRLFFRSPELEFATREIAAPERLTVATRHGDIRALVYSPPGAILAAQALRGERAPVHLLTHGGAYITRLPQEEGNVARYLASEVGCHVVIPDYSAAPQVRHPVAEQQCYDTLIWIRRSSAVRGWDGERVSVGGPSAGGHIALSVALAAIDAGGYVPVAVTSEYGVADPGRSDDLRTSDKRNPVVGPPLMRLVRNTYFKNVDLSTGQASPMLHPALGKLPPTLIMTAEFDTLRHESHDLAEQLRALGVQVTYRQFDGVDHGFTHLKPVATARAAITLIGDHLAAAYRAALVEP
ncbi:alpha/beta hydrolase fold domain-containing protein [Streptomyces sp. SID1121]|uniref:alpha/beta hydrolase fold domain-containing protein n=1 Tax=Streptomyces sp. SID1121 TaxID=3425888 RepID=UPI004056556D